MAGGSLNLLHTREGIIEIEDLQMALRSRHRLSLCGEPKLLCLENSINYHSGKIFPPEAFQKIASFARNEGLRTYLDGARLLNACLELDVSVSEYSKSVDSLMISFSKGLGAPVGSILLGDEDFILEARKYQKMVWGGLHQSGILAAAALYAIKNNIDNLLNDNSKAKLLGNLLKEDPCIKLNSELIETNIVMFSFTDENIDVTKFLKMAANEHILLYHWNHNTVRAVTHQDVDENQIKQAAYKISKILCEMNQFEKSQVKSHHRRAINNPLTADSLYSERVSIS